MKEIIDILFERNKMRKLLTKSDVKRICEIIINHNHYDNINKVIFKNVCSDMDKCGGEFIENRLYFYKEGIEASIEEDYSSMNKVNSLEGSKIDAYNYFYLTVIFHEFAHVRQDYLDKNDKNQLEAIFYQIENSLCNLPHDFYMENYENLPTEVNAFSKSSIDAYSIYQKLPKSYITDNDSCYYADYVLNQLGRFYDVDCMNDLVISPSERLLVSALEYNLTNIGVDEKELSDLILLPNNKSLYDRLLLGLPITYMDYAYLNLLQSAVKDRQKVPFIKKLKMKK